MIDLGSEFLKVIGIPSFEEIKEVEPLKDETNDLKLELMHLGLWIESGSDKANSLISAINVLKSLNAASTKFPSLDEEEFEILIK